MQRKWRPSFIPITSMKHVKVGLEVEACSSQYDWHHVPVAEKWCRTRCGARPEASRNLPYAIISVRKWIRKWYLIDDDTLGMGASYGNHMAASVERVMGATDCPFEVRFYPPMCISSVDVSRKLGVCKSTVSSTNNADIWLWILSRISNKCSMATRYNCVCGPGYTPHGDGPTKAINNAPMLFRGGRFFFCILSTRSAVQNCGLVWDSTAYFLIIVIVLEHKSATTKPHYTQCFI